MKDLFVTKFESKANCQLQNYKKKSSILVTIISLVFHSIDNVFIPIALKVVGPLLLDSNSSRDGTNRPFQCPIWQLTNKETKR